MLQRSRVSERLRAGMTVVIAGPPNVGKSTLLNYLARRDLAIVSPFSGTTRDSVEAAVDIGGFPATFVDTAGFRTALDPVEAEGVARAKRRAATSDLVLWLSDNDPGSSPAPRGGKLALIPGANESRCQCANYAGWGNLHIWSYWRRGRQTNIGRAQLRERTLRGSRSGRGRN